MTALKTPPEATIQQIQTLLTEGYGSGFTIFKELVQNADDVGAKRLLLAGHEGFARADNALLRAPGIFVANSGPVSAANWDALQLAAGGGKGGDAQAVGRFGLGQKALYHLCDAYVVFARLDCGATHSSMVLNPYEDIETAEHARAWQALSPNDDDIVSGWADQAEMGQGLVLYIPLRSATLRPGPDRRMCLTNAEWTPREALNDIIDGVQLHAALACLRHLERIDIKCPGENDWCVQLQSGFARLAGPGSDAQHTMHPAFGGQFTVNGQVALVHGSQHRAGYGEAMAARAREDWPKAWTLTGLEDAKATPHGAALVCRHPAQRRDAARLRIWQGVYLPLGDPASDRAVILGEEVLNGSENIDLVIHGDFFVSSNRSSILSGDRSKGQDAAKICWNEALTREAMLPCVLNAVASAVQALPTNKDRYDLIRALGKVDWWQRNAAAICHGRALARMLDASGETWLIEQASKLRPIPESDGTRPRRLADAWKDFDAWCKVQGFVLAQGTALGEARPRWSDRELAELIAGMAPAALGGKDAAQTLAAIIDDAVGREGALGPLALSAMAEAFRTAMRDKAKMAPMVQIKLLTRHLPTDRLIVLPKAVIEPDLLAHIAAQTQALCIRAGWLEDGHAPHTRPLPQAEAVDLLTALEPLAARQGRVADQAVTLIALVLEHGPSLEELASEGKAVSLKIIPAVRASDQAPVMLSPSTVLKLVGEKLVFDRGVGSIAKLAAAVVEPATYQLRANVSIKLPKGRELASSNRPADKVAVVGKVLRFGTLGDRIALFDDLHKDLPAPLLRRLIAGDAGLKDTDSLARIVGLPFVLMDIVTKLTVGDSTVRMIDPAFFGKQFPDYAEKANVTDLDLAWLGDQLVRRHALVEPFEDHQAMALLGSGLSRDVLVKLALHKVTGEDGLHRPDALLRGRLDAVPVAMRKLVRIVDPWPDRKAEAGQSGLIDDWTPERQIKRALADAEPHQFCAEIQEALGRIPTLGHTLLDELRQKAWLSVNGISAAPNAVHDLLPCALTAWGEVMAGPAPVLRSELPEALLPQLDRHGLIDDRAKSYHRVLCAMAANGMNGLVVDLMDGQAALTVLAKANCDLDEAAWPMLASTLRAFDSEDDLRPVLTGVAFAAPNTDSVVDQLNSLAMATQRDGRVGDAARRLWRAGFATYSQALRATTQFLPADLQVESEAGPFSRADKLALITTGVEDRDSLAARWHFDLPANYVPTNPGNDVPSVPIAEKAQELFAPFRPFHELHSAALMVLAILGRGPAIRRVAEQFQGNPGFDDICGDLDAASKRHLGLCDPLPDHMAHMRLDVVPLSEGQALVLSAAGTPMLARAEREGALLYGCIKAAGSANSWQLSMSPIEPRNLGHATGLLRDAVKKLVDPIGMRMPNQSNAVLAQFDRYLQSDQATLDELIADIKDGLAERIKKLTRGDYLKAALTRHDDDRKQGRHDNDDTQSRRRAKENLWAAIEKPEAADELLTAIREKMARRNYAPERTLFELFQNAVDAAHQKGEKSDVRVEATRDENGAICHLRFIHWGRPINVPGGPKTPLRYERDLDNMLDLDSSEKEGEDRGKHGLGFKTCHMLSDDTRVASGRLLFGIRGGMIPYPWEEGRALQQHYNTREAQATIVDLPIAPGRERDAGRAWDEFTKVAKFLPVTAPDIGQVIVVDGGGEGVLSGKAEVTPTPCKDITHVSYGGDQQALQLNLGSKHRLYLKLLGGVPVPFARGWGRLWNLAPLDGEDLKVAWLIDGAFEMDQGRRGLHGQADDKRAVMRRLSVPLGERLVELFEGWSAIAPAVGLALDGRDTFFARLIEHMIGDTSDHLARELHGMETRTDQIVAHHGLTKLFAKCGVVPLAAGGLVCAEEVEGVYRHTLTDKSVREKVDSWGPRFAAYANAIEDLWAQRLEHIGFDAPRGIDLGTLAQELFWSGEVDAGPAAMFGSVFNSSARDSWHPEERQRVDATLRTVQLRSESGAFVPSNQLWFQQDSRENDEGKTERQRAAFVPPEARLHPDYQGDAVEFAQLARRYLAHVERQHLANAYTQPARCLAALVYLADRPRQIAGLNWLPSVEALRGLPAYDSLTRQQRGTLEAWLGIEEPSPTDDTIGQDAIERSAEEILNDAAQWWQENREELSARHDKLTYGELDEVCGAKALQAGDDVAWFTMLALGSFQTLGRITPQQSRGIVLRGVKEEWWQDLARVGEHDHELRPYVDRLIEWSDIGASEDYLLWRRCLGDMCLIARNLGTYREILLALPQMIAQHGPHVVLTDLFRPSSSRIVGRMGLDAAPLAKSLGMGANWIVRELARRGVYDTDEATRVQPYAWSARLRIRNFMQKIGLGDFDSGVAQGLQIHRVVCDMLGEETRFGIDGDLPFELLNTRGRSSGWPAARGQILGGTWCAADLWKVMTNA